MALKFNRFNNGQLVRDFSLVHSLKTMIWNGENGKNEKSFFSRAPTAPKRLSNSLDSTMDNWYGLRLLSRVYEHRYGMVKMAKIVHFCENCCDNETIMKPS